MKLGVFEPDLKRAVNRGESKEPGVVENYLITISFEVKSSTVKSFQRHPLSERSKKEIRKFEA